MFEVATSVAPSLTANVSSLFNDPGMLLVIAIAAGIPLAFYVIKRVIGLVPKGK